MRFFFKTILDRLHILSQSTKKLVDRNLKVNCVSLYLPSPSCKLWLYLFLHYLKIVFVAVLKSFTTVAKTRSQDIVKITKHE